MPINNLREALNNKSQHDAVFGIYNKNNQFKIGDKPVKIDGDDLVINNQNMNNQRKRM